MKANTLITSCCLLAASLSLAGCDLLRTLDDPPATDQGGDMQDDMTSVDRDMSNMLVDMRLSEDMAKDMGTTITPEMGVDMNIPDLGQPKLIQKLWRQGASGDSLPWDNGVCLLIPDEGEYEIRFLGNTALEARPVVLESQDKASSKTWEKGPFTLNIAQGKWLASSWFGGKSIYGDWSGQLSQEVTSWTESVAFTISPQVDIATSVDSVTDFGSWSKTADNLFEPTGNGSAAAPYNANANPLVLEFEVPFSGLYQVSLAARNASQTRDVVALRFDSQRYVQATVNGGALDTIPVGVTQAGGTPLSVYLTKGTHKVSMVADRMGPVKVKGVTLQSACGKIDDVRVPDQGVFVAADASVVGSDGSFEKPYILADILADESNLRVKPGQTVWLRGGVYRGEFESKISGEPGKSIEFRPFPGEFVRFDGQAPATAQEGDKHYALKILGDHTQWKGIEVTSLQSETQRGTAQETGVIPAGIRIEGDDTLLSGLVIHDVAFGVEKVVNAGGGTILEDSILYNLGFYAKSASGTPEEESGQGVAFRSLSTRDGVSIRGNMFWGGFGSAVAGLAERGVLTGVRIQRNSVFGGNISMSGERVMSTVPGPYEISENFLWEGSLALGFRAVHKGALVLENVLVNTGVVLGGLLSFTAEENRFIFDKETNPNTYTQYIPDGVENTLKLLEGGQDISIEQNRYEGKFRFRHGGGPEWWQDQMPELKDWEAWQLGGNDGMGLLTGVSNEPVVVTHTWGNLGRGARYFVTVFVPKAASGLQSYSLDRDKIPQLEVGQTYRVIHLLEPIEDASPATPMWRSVVSGVAGDSIELPLANLKRASLKGELGDPQPFVDYPKIQQGQPQDQVFSFVIEGL